MPISKTTLIQIVFITSIVVGYFLIDFNKVLTFIQGEAKLVTQDKQCDLHKSACEVTIQDGTKYRLEFFPKNIPLMKELTIKLTISKESEKIPKLKIYATNMFMGEFLFQFKQQQDGSFIATGMLPTCPVGNMQWNADLIKESVTQKIGARFQFKTDI